MSLQGWLCFSAVEMSDEALAMKLQAELNAERPARERSRLGQRPPVRVLRTGGRSNGRVKYTYSDVSFPSVPILSTLLLKGPKGHTCTTCAA